MNTINSLQFNEKNSSLLISGARDGMIKIWDVYAKSKKFFFKLVNLLFFFFLNIEFRRCCADSGQPIYQFKAHSEKLNVALFGTIKDYLILSGGRDSTIR